MTPPTALLDVPEASVWEEIAVGLFSIGTTILRHRRAVIGWTAVGGVIALVVGMLMPAKYTATVSFMPQAADPNAGLRSLAGQFGLQLGATQANQSPDFYASLAESNVILAPIAADSFAVVVEGSARVEPLAEWLDAKGETPALRAENAIEALRDRVEPTVDRKTGVITVKVTTKWRALSVALGQRILAGINAFNLETRQSQASAERKFAEGRLNLAQDQLRAAENRLQGFLERNRQTSGSPQLGFERERLQREVSLRQQVVVTLAQALEDARLREVRDTPVITVVEAPSALLRPDPRKRSMMMLLGVLGGAVLAVCLAMLSDGARLAEAQREDAVATFRAEWRATTGEWRKRRSGAGVVPPGTA